jgi:hypothetical protein
MEDQVTGDWGKVHNEEVHSKSYVLLNKYFYGNQMKEDEVGGTCRMYEGEELILYIFQSQHEGDTHYEYIQIMVKES